MARVPEWSEMLAQKDAEIERLRAALERIASGMYSGVIYPTLPPQDPAVNCARAAIAVIRPTVLEEAAKEADIKAEYEKALLMDRDLDFEEKAAFQRGRFIASNIAAAIRALKDVR